jgi:hypothetical protein
MASTPNRRSRPPGPRDPEQGIKGARESHPSLPPSQPPLSGQFATTTTPSSPPAHGSGMHRLGTLPPPAHETLILGFSVPKERVPLVSHVRSTTIAATLAALVERGFEADYFRVLPEDLHATLRYTPAGVWVPIDIALQHYEACESIGLSPMEANEIGAAVATQIQRMVSPSVSRLQGLAGVAPWSVFGQFGRYFRRFFLGGEIAVFRHGARDGRIEMAGMPQARYAHFRHGVRGVLTGALRGFLGQVLVKEIERAATPTSMALRIAWV